MIFLRIYFSVFTVVLVLIEKIYQTLEKVFHQVHKVAVCQSGASIRRAIWKWFGEIHFPQLIQPFLKAFAVLMFAEFTWFRPD